MKFLILVLAIAACLAKPPKQEQHPRCQKYNEDSSTIIFGHEKDCAKYFVCNHQYAVEMECVQGTVFDPNQQVCSHEKSTCGVTEAPEKLDFCEDQPVGETFPVKNVCSSFYICLEDGPIIEKCSDELFYDREKKTCDFADKVNCTEPTPAPFNPKPTERPSNPGVKDERCARSNDEHPLTFPHKTDCTTYYTCVYGRAFPQQCPNGQHWNAMKNWCDFPEQAGCDLSLSPKPKPSRPITPGTAPPHLFPLHNGYETMVIVDPRCPMVDDMKHPIFIPHQFDCNKFYLCNNRLAYESKCPPGQHWNALKSWCDWPRNANCQKF